MKNLSELVCESARRYGTAPALQSAGAESEERISYSRLASLVNSGSGLLRAKGLAPGDRLLLYCESGPAWPVALFSILAGGMIGVPVAAEVPLSTAAGIAAFADVAALVLGTRTGALAPLFAGKPCVTLEEILHAPAVQDKTRPRGPGLAVLAFTSGSTTRPRAVELTHANLIANLEAMLLVREAEPGDTFLSMLPPAHLFELMVGQLGPLACGARIVYARSLLPNRLIAAIRQDGITHALSVPALLDALYLEILEELAEAGMLDPSRRGQSLDETAAYLERATAAELDELRAGFRLRVGERFHSLFLGGAALDPAWTRIAPRLGIQMGIGYGLTEAGPIVSSGMAGDCPPGSVGRPLSGVEVRISGNGEVLVRGPNVMRGYFRDPAATAATLHDGWLRTGDRGRIDENGFLFITGRLKEAMVAAAGTTIYPDEIEPYYASPAFKEWCVAAMPGTHGNDVPTLFVVPAKPELPDADLRRVFEDLRAAAPACFRLQGWKRISSPLPRTALGKVRRRFLAEEIAQGRLS
jgi:long-chain acyl-CoA synthetase